ncbi:MAG: MGMT family protein [Candidatus Levybacteria bacterium]|nr:MGMT family protein [Candidatus Levybacteria bacterium]
MFEDIYKIVRSIPKGNVMTYGDVAFILSSQLGFPSRRLARVVGYSLHANKDVNTPCHRVVNKQGRLAPNFAFDGWEEQRRRLLSEGVSFLGEMYVDLEKHQYKLKSQSSKVKTTGQNSKVLSFAF